MLKFLHGIVQRNIFRCILLTSVNFLLDVTGHLIDRHGKIKKGCKEVLNKEEKMVRKTIRAVVRGRNPFHLISF